MNIHTAIVLLAAITLSVGCANSSSPPTIKIGVLLALTGEGAQYGITIEKTIRLAIEEVNAAGGINGKSIELITEDGKCSKQEGAKAAKTLIKNRVKFIIGGACSTETLGAAPVTEAESVILFSPSATHPDITKAGSFVFRTAPSDALTGKIAALEARKRGHNTATVISERTKIAQDTAQEFSRAFESRGGKILANLIYEDTMDSDQFTKTTTNTNSSMIYISSQLPKNVISIIKIMKEHRNDTIQEIYTQEILNDKEFVRKNQNILEGTIGFERAFHENKPLTQKALAAYRAKYGEPPFPIYQAGAYEIVQLLTEGLELFGENTEKIKHWLLMTNERDSAVGKLTIDKNGDASLEYRTLQLIGGKVIKSEPPN